MSDSNVSSKLFPGYNLRGLIFTYLEEAGWTWNEADESWTRGEDRYEGPYASQEAMGHQIEAEEGRRL